MKVKKWKEYINDDAQFIIHYPTCGGGEECIDACPFREDIWSIEPMIVSLFGVRTKVRYRPVFRDLELCEKCYKCVKACPTGALRINKGKNNTFYNPFFEALILFYNTVKIFFKKDYNLKFVLRREHIEKFKRNN